MEPEFKTLAPKKLLGKCVNMSLANNLTQELWRSFMPVRHTIPNAVGTDLLSLQVYPPTYFTPFDPNREFVKWAVREVQSFESVPDDLKPFELEGGDYAVFYYKGPSTDPRVFRYIFSQWLPQSGYQLDQRPHFEVLGEKYLNNDPQSEEEIWIPVRELAGKSSS